MAANRGRHGDAAATAATWCHAAMRSGRAGRVLTRQGWVGGSKVCPRRMTLAVVKRSSPRESLWEGEPRREHGVVDVDAVVQHGDAHPCPACACPELRHAPARRSSARLENSAGW